MSLTQPSSDPLPNGHPPIEAMDAVKPEVVFAPPPPIPGVLDGARAHTPHPACPPLSEEAQAATETLSRTLSRTLNSDEGSFAVAVAILNMLNAANEKCSQNMEDALRLLRELPGNPPPGFREFTPPTYADGLLEEMGVGTTDKPPSDLRELLIGQVLWHRQEIQTLRDSMSQCFRELRDIHQIKMALRAQPGGGETF